MQRACAILPAASLSPPSFWTFSQKRHSFRKRLVNIKYVFLFYLQYLFETSVILRKIRREFVTNLKMSAFEVLVSLVGF